MSDRRFLNPAQPQTLQIAVFLLYAEAVFALLSLVSPPLLLVALVELIIGTKFLSVVLVVVGYALGAYGIANEKKWGYILGIVMAVAPFALGFYYVGDQIFGAFGLLGLLFAIALIALLIHPQSREYQRIWFK